jgi:hypothetical protein
VVAALDLVEALFDEPDGLEEQAPTPAASRPTAATATSPLCVRFFVLIFAFPVVKE